MSDLAQLGRAKCFVEPGHPLEAQVNALVDEFGDPSPGAYQGRQLIDAISELRPSGPLSSGERTTMSALCFFVSVLGGAHAVVRCFVGVLADSGWDQGLNHFSQVVKPISATSSREPTPQQTEEILTRIVEQGVFLRLVDGTQPQPSSSSYDQPLQVGQGEGEAGDFLRKPAQMRYAPTTDVSRRIVEEQLKERQQAALFLAGCRALLEEADQFDLEKLNLTREQAGDVASSLRQLANRFAPDAGQPASVVPATAEGYLHLVSQLVFDSIRYPTPVNRDRFGELVRSLQTVNLHWTVHQRRLLVKLFEALLTIYDGAYFVIEASPQVGMGEVVGLTVEQSFGKSGRFVAQVSNTPNRSIRRTQFPPVQVRFRTSS